VHTTILDWLAEHAHVALRPGRKDGYPRMVTVGATQARGPCR
jgi:hypothetical protein